MVKLTSRVGDKDETYTLETFERPQSQLELNENCCEMAMEVWERTIEDRLTRNRDITIQNYVDLLSVQHLDCKTFMELLMKLQLIKGTAGVQLIGTINGLVSRYIPKLTKLPTTMLEGVADACKTAGAKAAEAWRNCTEEIDMQNRPVKQFGWSDQIQQSVDIANNDWFSTLKAMKCPECGEREFKLSKYQKGRSGYGASGRRGTRAVMECSACGHKERFA
tara:strand:- start:4370 stop:5032 length:663 start_codon:yes stop_codon:yes gene_type:complete